jgi:integrase
MGLKRMKLFDSEIYDTKVSRDNRQLLLDYKLEMKANGKSDKTIYQYLIDLKGFFCWMVENGNDGSILDMKKRDFRSFFLAMDEHGASAARINRMQCSIRNLLAFCEADDEYDEYEQNRMRSIKGLKKKPVREIVFLTDDQVTKLIDYYMEKEKYREALYISLSYDSAARREEVRQVEKKDFLKRKQTNTVIGKEGYHFKLYYFDRTRAIAKKYFEQRGEDDTDALFIVGKDANKKEASYSTLYAWVLGFRKALLEITGEEILINPHSFRHSALENYSNGTHHTLKEFGISKMPLKALKSLAHHKSSATTETYLINKDEELLEGIIDGTVTDEDITDEKKDQE